MAQWKTIYLQKKLKNTLLVIIGKKGKNKSCFFNRYKKSPNDEFEWYYDYQTLRDIFMNYYDENASISFKNDNSLVLLIVRISSWLWKLDALRRYGYGA